MPMPVFPETNPCGKLFNAFINNAPVLESCMKLGSLLYCDQTLVSIKLLPPSTDVIHFTLNNGDVSVLEYETFSTEITEEIKNYLDAHYKRKRFNECSTLRFYNIYLGLIFATTQRIGCRNVLGIRKI